MADHFYVDENGTLRFPDGRTGDQVQADHRDEYMQRSLERMQRMLQKEQENSKSQAYTNQILDRIHFNDRPEYRSHSDAHVSQQDREALDQARAAAYERGELGEVETIPLFRFKTELTDPDAQLRYLHWMEFCSYVYRRRLIEADCGDPNFSAKAISPGDVPLPLLQGAQERPRSVLDATQRCWSGFPQPTQGRKGEMAALVDPYAFPLRWLVGLKHGSCIDLLQNDHLNKRFTLSLRSSVGKRGANSSWDSLRCQIHERFDHMPVAPFFDMARRDGMAADGFLPNHIYLGLDFDFSGENKRFFSNGRPTIRSSAPGKGHPLHLLGTLTFRKASAGVKHRPVNLTQGDQPVLSEEER